jgi:hypothetical protein
MSSPPAIQLKFCFILFLKIKTRKHRNRKPKIEKKRERKKIIPLSLCTTYLNLKMLVEFQPNSFV